MPESDRNTPTPKPIARAALGFALVFPSLLTWLYFVALTDAPTPLQQSVYTAGKVLQFAFPIVIVFLLTRRGPRIPWSWRRRFGDGIVSGLVILVSIVVLWRILERTGSPLLADLVPNISAKLVDLGITTPTRYFALALFYSIFHTFLEEYYWRWFVFGQLRLRTSLVPALLISSIAFMAHHVIVVGAYAGWSSPHTYLFSVAVAIGGAYWAWLYERSESIVAPWVSHIFVDVAIFAVGKALIS